MPRTAFSTIGCPDWSWNDLLRHGPEYGFDGVEIRLISRETDLLQLPEFAPAQRKRRRSELAAAGFQVCGFASSVRFDDPDAGVRKVQIDIGKAHLELAVELGASFVRVFGDVVPPANRPQERETVIGNIADGLQRLGEFGEEMKVDVLIETHGDFSDSRLVRETLCRVESPAAGVLWDTHHPWRFYGEKLSETFARLQPWVRHTHWKDSVSQTQRQTDAQTEQAARQAHALMSGHRHADYVLFGTGEFPATDCMGLLCAADYDGWFCLEWEKMWHPDIEEPEVALPPFPAAIQQLCCQIEGLKD